MEKPLTRVQIIVSALIGFSFIAVCLITAPGTFAFFEGCFAFLGVLYLVYGTYEAYQEAGSEECRRKLSFKEGKEAYEKYEQWKRDNGYGE